jgi:hypothetical protein
MKNKVRKLFTKILSQPKSTSFVVELSKKLEEIQRKKQELSKLFSSKSNQKSEPLNITQKPTTNLLTNNRPSIKEAKEKISSTSSDENDEFEYRYWQLTSKSEFLNSKLKVVNILFFIENLTKMCSTK